MELWVGKGPERENRLIPPRARRESGQSGFQGMLTGLGCSRLASATRAVCEGDNRGQGARAKHVQQYPLQCPPTQVHGHCGSSGIEAKLLVGDDARWLPSASPPPRGSEPWRKLILKPRCNSGGCLNHFGSHISEANMGQTSPDRRVILRGLGFGWGREEN